jgi:hypothetical protein
MKLFTLHFVFIILALLSLELFQTKTVFAQVGPTNTSLTCITDSLGALYSNEGIHIEWTDYCSGGRPSNDPLWCYTNGWLYTIFMTVSYSGSSTLDNSWNVSGNFGRHLNMSAFLYKDSTNIPDRNATLRVIPFFWIPTSAMEKQGNFLQISQDQFQ